MSEDLYDGHDAMFWRQLLEKYIDHVGTEEGTDFLVIRCDDQWTDAEWQALERASRVAP